MNATLTTIDLKTAHEANHSICQVGLMSVEKGIIVQKLNILVQPPDNYYTQPFMEQCEATPANTATAPTFAVVWQQIAPFITGQGVIAYNEVIFACLEQTLAYYNIEIPYYIGRTLDKLYQNNFASLCEKYNITFNEPNAYNNALMCFKVLKSI